MSAGLIESIPDLVVFPGIVALILVACEVGFLLGRFHHVNRPDKDAPSSIGPMVGGLLSMLAFVLGLTFSMAVGQYQTRRQNVIEEANVIRSAYLYADMVGVTRGAEIKRLLREYVDVRLRVVHDHDVTAAAAKSDEIHRLLWAKAVDAVVANPHGEAVMVARSIVAVIDMGEQRKLAGLRSRIPDSVWGGLLIITFLSMTTLGIQVGLLGKRRWIALVPLSIAFAVLITLVVDIDQPQSGFITVSQQAMVDLRATMGQP